MHNYQNRISLYKAGNKIDINSHHRNKSQLVFIDCGARKGENFHWDGVTKNSGVLSKDLRICGGRGLPFRQDNFLNSEIHMFEPNSEMWSEERHNTAREVSRYASAVYVHECAAWTKNEEKDLFVSVDQWGDCGTSLCKDKLEKLDISNPKLVPCIDFCEFINSNFDVNDDVVVKFDIEGAEYDILPKMIQDEECISKIDSLFVEWHGNFFPAKHSYFYPEFMTKVNQFNKKYQFHYSSWSPGW